MSRGPPRSTCSLARTREQLVIFYDINMNAFFFSFSSRLRIFRFGVIGHEGPGIRGEERAHVVLVLL